jgi:hypothetical protein
MAVRLFVAVLVCAALLVIDPTLAVAATPFTLGQGLAPAVAVGPDGAGLFAWSDAGSGNPLHYCKVPKGASSCSISKTFTPPENGSSNSNYVFVNGSTVQVVTGRCCDDLVLVYTSTDGGANFSGPVQIGSINIEAGLAAGPGAGFSGYYFNPLQNFQFMSAAGPQQTAVAHLAAPFVALSAGTAVDKGTTPVVVLGSDSATSLFRWSGTGDVNDATTWIGPTAISPAGNVVRVASGGSGPAMLLEQIGAGGSGRLVAMKFDGTTFGSTATLQSGSPAFPTISADQTGRATVLWRFNDELRFSQTTNGTTWSSPVTLLSGGTEPGLTFNLRVATGSDGHGYAMWTRPVGGGAPDNVRAMQLSPGGASSGGGEQTTSVDTGDQVITFFTPKQCQAPGAKVRVHVTSKTKQKLARGQGRSKILFVDFQLDGKTKLRDKKAAFRTKIDVKGLKAGSTHTLGANISLKQLTSAKRGFKKTLKAKLTIC